MNIIFEKYGSSSLAIEDQINSVAQHVVQSKKSGYRVVVVVSAMGKTTDDLIFKAKSVNRDSNRRELSLLLSVGDSCKKNAGTLISS
jgi:aspartate kinase